MADMTLPDGPISFAAALLLLVYVALQRGIELLVARRNTRRLLDEGGFEISAPHYRLIVLLHAAWLIVLWLMAPRQPVYVVPLVLFAGVQVLRFWTLASIGKRWTTRIIVKPGEKLVVRGPYRFLAHPNYLVVALEIALLPLVFGLWPIAILFTVLNAAAMSIRIPAEARALAEFTQGRSIPSESLRP